MANRKPGRAAAAELDAFRKALSNRATRGGELATLFDKGPITVVRVPARLDVMGGIADYSGANVSEYPLAHGAVLGIQKRRDRWIRVVSVGIEKHNLANDFAINMEGFYSGSRVRAYEKMRQLFERDVARSWAAYVVGAVFVLLKEKKVRRLGHGFNIGLVSHVPMNVGIGSSATVEMAALYAVDQLLGLRIDQLELARLGQTAENRVVGAPCGLMDQITVTCGRQDQLLHILCQPDILCGAVDVPEFCEFAGINSMVKHSVGGARYTDVRVATFMGRRIIFDRLRRIDRLKRNEQPFGGYLCNITPSDYANVYAKWLPKRITGAEFLKKHKTTDDPAAAINPKKAYLVESRTSHPIYETWRVTQFIGRLNQARITGDRRFLIEAGKLMYASHWSYARKCGLSCKEVDFLVRTVRRMGVRAGLYGAKITGGGSGGTVAVMGEKGKLKPAIKRIVAAYQEAYGHKADVFTGSSPGAYEFGSVKLKRA